MCVCVWSENQKFNRPDTRNWLARHGDTATRRHGTCGGNLIGQIQGIGLQGAISLLKKIKRGGGVGDVYLAVNSCVLSTYPYFTPSIKISTIEYTYPYFTPSPDKLSKISIQIPPPPLLFTPTATTSYVRVGRRGVFSSSYISMFLIM